MNATRYTSPQNEVSIPLGITWNEYLVFVNVPENNVKIKFYYINGNKFVMEYL